MRTDPQPAGAGRAEIAGAPTAVRAPVRAVVLVAALALLAVLAATPAALAAPGPALRVDAAADRRPIPDDIYGMSFADPALAAEIGLPFNRWGGNYTDRYNWRIDTWNTGRDWFFENQPGCWPACAGSPPADPSRGYERIVDGDRAVGADTLLTLPMVGWVPKAARYRHPLLCSFPRSAIADQDGWDWEWVPPEGAGETCGDGRRGGAWLRGLNDPAHASEPSTPQLSADWIAAIRARYGDGAIRLYGLGNEPGLWDDTHVDVHPEPAGYDEIAEKSIALAKAAKAADPAGQTLGFSEWGWPNYECSSIDLAAHPWRRCTPEGPDRAAHGGQPLATWFLDRMREASRQCRVRLLDYFDLHYYAQGGSSTDVSRSLWDPSYVDPSWIGEPIALLPRMRRWVADHYPGTKIALTEYDLSLGGDAVTDTLLQADALGIFARERVDLAARWGGPTADEQQAQAFRLYRNYDGAGSRFGGTWVRSESGDEGVVAVYGALRDGDRALTVALINKSGAVRDSSLALSGLAAGAAGTAQVWRWRPGDSGFARGADVARGGDGSLALSLPARSLTMVVLPGAVAAGALPGVPASQPVGPLNCDPAEPGPREPEPGEPGGREPEPGPGPGEPGPGDPRQGDPAPGGDDGPRSPGGGGSARAPSLADRLGLPPNGRCIRGRALRFRVRSPNGRPLRAATVRVSPARGIRARSLAGRALRRPITVRGLPKRGAYTVTVAVRTAGRRGWTTASRRYRACR